MTLELRDTDSNVATPPDIVSCQNISYGTDYSFFPTCRTDQALTVFKGRAVCRRVTCGVGETPAGFDPLGNVICTVGGVPLCATVHASGCWSSGNNFRLHGPGSGCGSGIACDANGTNAFNDGCADCPCSTCQGATSAPPCSVVTASGCWSAGNEFRTGPNPVSGWNPMVGAPQMSFPCSNPSGTFCDVQTGAAIGGSPSNYCSYCQAGI